MYKIFVRGLEFYGYHGVSAEERTIGHRYRMDIEVEADGTADHTDGITNTVDYGAAAQKALGLAQASQQQTVERVATLVAEGLLAWSPLIVVVQVTLAKIAPPMPYIAAEAGVEVVRAQPRTD